MLPRILIGVVILVVAVMTFGFFTKDKFPQKGPPLGLDKFFPSRDYFADTAGMTPCGDKKELFTYSHLNLSDFEEITPLGLLSPTAHTLPTAHLYFNIKKTEPGNDSSMPVETDLIAPADIKITSIKWSEAKNKPEWNDGALVFGVCKEFKAYFDHIKSFSDKIKQAFDKNPVKSCTDYTLSYPDPIGTVDYHLCQAKVDIDIKAGEKIGIAGGGEGQRVLDVGAFDLRIPPHKFAKLERWQDRQQMQYVVCALDYFPTSIQQEMEQRLGGMDRMSNKVKSPSCGDVVQDVPGTAMGVWVTPDTDYIEHEPPYLALAHDNIEPQYLVFSMGESAQKAGLPIGKYTFLPKNEGLVNRHFKDITSDGKVYCFETEDRYQSWKEPIPTRIIIDMPTPEKLRIQKLNTDSCGTGPWQMDNFAEFVR